MIAVAAAEQAHELNVVTVCTIAGAVVLWGLASRRLTAWNVSMPMAFLGLGAAAHQAGWLDVGLSDTTLKSVAEITLALVLFGDAARIDVALLRRNASLAVRLLLIGLPMTIALGAVMARWIVPGASLALAAVIGASVAPTDAALGAAIVEDERVPGFIRRILNTESGLNDGIATPFVALFIAITAIDDFSRGDGGGGAVRELGIGLGVGLAIGLGAAFALTVALRQNWAAPKFVPLAVTGVAVLTYAASVQLGGNGFIGAFVGGMAFGARYAAPEDAVEFVVEAGELLAGLLWILFGSVVAIMWPGFTWRHWLFAVVALTVVRMVPVALCLVGTKLDRSTVAFIGWAGPRGLASLVFTLLAVEQLEGEAILAARAILATVALSVAAHGISASPLAARFSRTHPDPDAHPHPFAGPTAS